MVKGQDDVKYGLLGRLFTCKPFNKRDDEFVERGESTDHKGGFKRRFSFLL